MVQTHKCIEEKFVLDTSLLSEEQHMKYCELLIITVTSNDR